MQDKITNIILSACYGDVLYYQKLLKSKKISTDHLNYSNKIKGKQWSYNVEMMIITIKSMLPSIEEIGVRINYDRFNKEMDLWKHYRHGENRSIMNILYNNNEDMYWNIKDSSIYGRLIPIILVNKSFKIIKDEIIKNVLYTTGNLSCVLESLMLSKLFFLKFNNNTDYKELISELKEEVIHFSQDEFINKYKNFFRFNIESYTDNFKIAFERKKIEVINLLNNIDNKSEYKLLKYCLSIYDNEFNRVDINKYNFFLYAYKYLLLSEKEQNEEIKDISFIKRLCKYLLKLRNGRIDPQSLKITKYYLPNIFNYKKDDEFNHSLLNKCKVINRYEDIKQVDLILKTKSGTYRFRKIKYLN